MLIEARPSATIAAMKLQFSLATLLLAVLFAAITFGSLLAWHDIVIGSVAHGMSFMSYVRNFINCSPYWVPFGMLGYAIGRRQLTVPIVIAHSLPDKQLRWWQRTLRCGRRCLAATLGRRSGRMH